MISKLLEKYDCDTEHRIQAIFSSIFIQKNRLQTACEKIQGEISMKQWLLLAMLECCPKPKTLTNVGRLMGCSRQNVKKLANILEKKRYLTMTSGSNNSICLDKTNKVEAYSKEISNRRQDTLDLLFLDFTEEEIRELFKYIKKLYAGIERVEDYSDTFV